ncbi:SH3 domain-containing protein [Bacillus mexicanus]|uniref:SH3 domain-containing protein n=1 Tax=Bacillus mexicanus TaxID=2834415 RepID=UPI003D1C9CB4
MNKITQGVMALSLVIPSAALIQSADQVSAQTQSEVTSYSLNVRSGPGSNYKIVDWLKKGQIVNVIKDGSQWDYVQFNNGKTGYVYDKYLKHISSSDTSTVTAYSLTLRSGPSSNNKAIDWLKKGTKVTVLSSASGDWVKVSSNGKTGYVNGKYLSSTSVSSSTTVRTTSNSSNSYKVNAYSLTLRTGPNANNEAIDWLKKDTKVNVLSTSGGWSKVSVNGKTGYVNSKYLTKTVNSSSSNSTTSSTSSEIKEVSAYWLTMRNGPSANYKAVDYLKKGTDVVVHSYKGDWAYVTASGKNGYVNSKYLSKTSSTSPSNLSNSTTTSGQSQTKYVISPDGLNLRSGRGISNKIVVNMPYGVSVKVSDVSNGWGKVQYGGHTGYANVNYLSFVKPSSSSTPAKSSGSLKGKLIALDPGHGGPYAGAQGIVDEEDVNLQIALKTRDKLQSLGAHVIMTRTSDTACSTAGYRQDLSCRPALATRMGADAFISIHANSGSSSASGSEAYYYNSSRGDKQLASNIANEFREDVGMKVRQVSYANFAVLRGSTVPSTLVETGFVTNKSDASKLGSSQYQDKFAKAIAEGIQEYFE